MVEPGSYAENRTVAGNCLGARSGSRPKDETSRTVKEPELGSNPRGDARQINRLPGLILVDGTVSLDFL
jgi:hypothetical protein